MKKTKKTILSPFLCLVLFLLGSSCHAKTKQHLISLPRIPERTLREPSSLAFDGESFYIADWRGHGILRLRKDSSVSWIAMMSQPIQVVAIDKGLLVIETNDGKLHEWQESTEKPSAQPNPVTLTYDFPRQAGSPFCWDGIYLWHLDSSQLRATIALSNHELVLLPECARSISPPLSNQEELVGLACGWTKSVALIRYRSSSLSKEKKATQDSWYSLMENFFNNPKNQPRPWEYQNLTPVAVTWMDSGTLVALAEHKDQSGVFSLVLWN